LARSHERAKSFSAGPDALCTAGQVNVNCLGPILLLQTDHREFDR
jgi:hypothetical protein